MNHCSKIIVIEGIDGSGKTTIIEKYLKPSFSQVVFLKDPHSSVLFDRFKDLLFSDKLSFNSEILLFYLLRSDLIDRINLFLKNGMHVVLDRFTDSTIAYQGFGRNISLEAISFMNKYFCSGIEANFSILLDCDAAVAISRKKTSCNDLHMDYVTLNKVREGYLNIFKNKPKSVILENSHNNSEFTGKLVVKHINRILSV